MRRASVSAEKLRRLSDARAGRYSPRIILAMMLCWISLEPA
jgi:hypothetical protein